jgi:hypothetical protein
MKHLRRRPSGGSVRVLPRGSEIPPVSPSYYTLTESIYRRIDLFCSACLVRVEQPPAGLSYVLSRNLRSALQTVTFLKSNMSEASELELPLRINTGNKLLVGIDYGTTFSGRYDCNGEDFN